MKGITYCGACADYDIKKHRCKHGAKLENNPQDKFFDDCPLPTIVPVVRGRWKASGGLLECQNCGEIYSRLGGNEGKAWDYCPNCGARMDGDENG